jgi:hypothetical protein
MKEAGMGPPFEIQTFDRLTLVGRRWFFRIVSTRNWEKIAQSESYNRPGARNETAHDLAEASGWPVIPERKKR